MKKSKWAGGGVVCREEGGKKWQGQRDTVLALSEGVNKHTNMEPSEECTRPGGRGGGP